MMFMSEHDHLRDKVFPSKMPQSGPAADTTTVDAMAAESTAADVTASDAAADAVEAEATHAATVEETIFIASSFLANMALERCTVLRPVRNVVEGDVKASNAVRQRRRKRAVQVALVVVFMINACTRCFL